LCQYIYVPEPGKRTDKEQYNHKKRCAKLFIQKHARKGAQKNGDQHINAKLRYQGQIPENILIHFCIPFADYTTLTPG
jgi:hypothetical protein